MKFVVSVALMMSCISWADPLIVAVLMVKNEAPVIDATLQPLVDGGINSFFIFDTGSTDGTPEVATEFFKKNSIVNAHVTQEPFIDFATSRNRALELTEQRFPHATFILMLDAEWYMQGVKSLRSFCETHIENTENAVYAIRLCARTYEIYHPRLLRAASKIRFVGAVHEDVNTRFAFKLVPEIFFEYRPSRQGTEASKQRWLQDKEILLREHIKNPQDARTLFYLGQTYGGLGKYKEAYHYFLKSADAALQAKNVNKVHNAYQAFYKAALTAEILANQHENYSRDNALNHYLDAHVMCPDRAEPLVNIAKHYWNTKQYDHCFSYAYAAAEIPFPNHTAGPVEKDVYDFERYELLAGAAAELEKYDIAEWATKKALQARPEALHLYQNLEIILKLQQNTTEPQTSQRQL